MAATTQVVGAAVNGFIFTPLAVILVHYWQMSRGIDPAYEFEAVAESKGAVKTSGSAAER